MFLQFIETLLTLVNNINVNIFLDGQCPDPKYPADGYLIGDTFEKGARITFGCRDSTFQPLNSSGLVSEGMVCRYNATSKKMEWVGEMPQCIGIYLLFYFLSQFQHF